MSNYKKYRKPKCMKPLTKQVRCDNCTHCVYVGEGGYLCDVKNEIVIDDWIPTENYYTCKGVEFNNANREEND